MIIIQPYYEIFSDISNLHAVTRLEKIGRVCYKSENKITEDSAKSFVKMIKNSKHLSVLEHVSITVKFVHNRGFSHKLVRHRLAAYSQESTRYCDYSKDKFNNELTFIKPYWWDDGEQTNYTEMARKNWFQCMELIEISYKNIIKYGLQPQAARGILPNDLKTEIIMTANLREWLHVFELRTIHAAHPNMKRIMIPLQKEFIEILPQVFHG